MKPLQFMKLPVLLLITIVMLELTTGYTVAVQEESRRDGNQTTDFVQNDRLESTGETKSSRPNILFILADDLSYDTVGYSGNTQIQTPHIDELARRGTVFTHSYNMGGWNGAVCLASRAMLNTGCFLWNAHHLDQQIREFQRIENEAAETNQDKNQERLDDEKAQEVMPREKFWSELISDAGYETFFTGKWHVSVGADQLFDHVRHVRGGMPRQTEAGYNRPIEGAQDNWSPSDPQFGGYWEGGRHWSEVVADDALIFLDRAKSNDKPFFMYIAFNAPHDPRQAPQEYVDMYPQESIEMPANFLFEYPFKDVIGCSDQLRDERLAPFPRTPFSVRVNRQEYYAITSHMDRQIGRIMAALEESGMAENTIVVFTADHGLACGHHGLLGKQNMYEHSMRVPLIIGGPGMEAGRRIDSPVYMQDVMPTTLEVAGTEKPDHVEFQSLLPLIRGERDEQYREIYGAYEMELQRMIVRDNLKLIVYPKAPVIRLFDLEKDPLEMNDLAADPEYSIRRENLLEQLFALQAAMNDSLDLRAVLHNAADR